MKRVITGIFVLFMALMAIVWIVAERAQPKMLPQPAAFQTGAVE